MATGTPCCNAESVMDNCDKEEHYPSCNASSCMECGEISERDCDTT